MTRDGKILAWLLVGVLGLLVVIVVFGLVLPPIEAARQAALADTALRYMSVPAGGR